MGLGKKMRGFPKSVGLFSLLYSQAISRLLVKSCSSTVMHILMSIPKILKIWKCLEDADKNFHFQSKTLATIVSVPTSVYKPKLKDEIESDPNEYIYMFVCVYVYVYSDKEKVPSRKTLQSQAQ